MFLDASAIVAILALEPDYGPLAERLDAAADPTTSPIAVFEAAQALARDRELGLQRARILVEEFLQRSGTDVLPIAAQTADIALDAHARYGKRSGHPARLNMGDCFAYAMAKQHGVPLLYKGEDFAQTDLALTAPLR
jgi:ribonuclease VapC